MNADLLKPGLEMRFTDGTVKLLKKYPGVWKCEITIPRPEKPPYVVRKNIEDRQIVEWAAASRVMADPVEEESAGPRHPSCEGGCYMFGPESEHRAPCEAKCRLMDSSQRDWHETRRQWNEQGLCAREACRAEMDEGRRKHPTTGLQYCASCSNMLAEAQNIGMLEIT